MFRFIKGIFNRPIFDSIFESIFAIPKMPSPFRHRPCFSFVGNGDIRASIVSINNRQNPSAIIWGISKIIIDAINAMFIAGAIPHVRNKSIKAVYPSIANFYASGNVRLISAIKFFASFFHALPNFIFRHGCYVSPVTSAVSWSPMFKLISRISLKSSTLTSCPPSSVTTWRIFCSMVYGKFSNLESGKIIKISCPANRSPVASARSCVSKPYGRSIQYSSVPTVALKKPVDGTVVYMGRFINLLNGNKFIKSLSSNVFNYAHYVLSPRALFAIGIIHLSSCTFVTVTPPPHSDVEGHVNVMTMPSVNTCIISVCDVVDSPRATRTGEGIEANNAASNMQTDQKADAKVDAKVTP